MKEKWCMKIILSLYDDDKETLIATAQEDFKEEWFDSRTIQDDMSDHLHDIVNNYEDSYRDEEPWDGFNSDAEADADALASAGWGTDEDYGSYYD
jgi:hypothetical protein